MQEWGWDVFGDDRIEVVHVQAVEIFGWDDEGDVALNVFPSYCSSS
jgi:hypothetical protein